MNLKELIRKYLIEQLNKDKEFVVDTTNNIFLLFLNKTLVAHSYFSIEDPDELFNQKYVGLFKLITNKDFRGKGYMKYLLNEIFNYIKQNLDIHYILLNVYKSNENALKLYFNNGFEIYKDYDDDDDDQEEEPYFTLIKKL